MGARQDAERHVTRASAKSEAVSPLSFTAQPLTPWLRDCLSLGFLPFYPHCLANRSLLSPDFCLLHPCIIIGVCASGVFTGLLFLSCFSLSTLDSRLPTLLWTLVGSLSILPLSLPFLLSPFFLLALLPSFFLPPFSTFPWVTLETRRVHCRHGYLAAARLCWQWGSLVKGFDLFLLFVAMHSVGYWI